MYFHEIMFVDRVYDLETLYQKKPGALINYSNTLYTLLFPSINM